MSWRPDRLPFLAVRVLKACAELAWGAKAVWIEDWHLDQGPEGAWISAPHLAERLGMSHSNVEEHRRTLKKLGLYHVVERKGARSNGWIPMLPEICIPRSANDISRCAAWLAQHIRGLLDGGISGLPAPAIGGPPQAGTSGTAESALRGLPQSAMAMGGGKGGAPSSLSSRGMYMPLPPQDREKQDGELLTQLGRKERKERRALVS